MSVCQLQVNSPTTIQGVSILPGNYEAQVDRRPSMNQPGGEAVTYKMHVDAAVTENGVELAIVTTLDVTSLVEEGTITAIS